ncbi:UDP-N-acetylmuramoylalanine--D-glutamate ligase [bioreactor metagenome]|uniref:UDP-N-acetylmuramoylalanine--D-glutamate ligase n=1 Tax=bioreactor metagenome TaxID=1076179 RepID=A0A645E307_9ZZZZ
MRYVNDSKATNPAAVLAALRALEPVPQGNVLLLAGGLDKDMDFEALAAAAPWLKLAALYGACRAKIMTVLRDLAPTVECASFEEAFERAREQAESGDIVLLSPAAASMDMFKDYRERGETFVRLVRASALRQHPGQH